MLYIGDFIKPRYNILLTNDISTIHLITRGVWNFIKFLPLSSLGPIRFFWWGIYVEVLNINIIPHQKRITKQNIKAMDVPPQLKFSTWAESPHVIVTIIGTRSEQIVSCVKKLFFYYYYYFFNSLISLHPNIGLKYIVLSWRLALRLYIFLSTSWC